MAIGLDCVRAMDTWTLELGGIMYTQYLRKAWEVVGYTYEGAVYCPECVAYTDPEVTGDTGTRVDDPAPVFVSDDYAGMTCEVCTNELG